MKIKISKEWCEASARKEAGMSVEAGNPRAVVDHMFGLWFAELTALATPRGLTWLLGDAASHRGSFDEGLSPQDELGHLIAEATRNA